MLAVITPSRGRPANAERLQAALRDTCNGPFMLWLGVDEDDPDLDAYQALSDDNTYVIDGPRNHLCGWTNRLAALADEVADADWLASLGDDHLPLTTGWDRQLIAAIERMDGPGWAYGNDLLRGQDIPTAWVQSAVLARALGWMMLPTCEHLGVDLVVRDLGRAADRIAYLDDVIVEHVHFVNGKASNDATYEHGNSRTRIRDDNAAHAAWLRSAQFAADVATVKSLTYVRS